MTQPRWIDRRALELLHDEGLVEHGGSPGLRDDNLLESPLARPKNVFAYEGVTDISRLAASYAYGIARNHPFVDDNKRTAFIAAALFMTLNGLKLEVDQVDAYNTVVGLAAGDVDEAGFADWLRRNSRNR